MKTALRAAAAGLLACTVSGCAAPPLMVALSATDMVTFGVTGKSLEEHGLDVATGENCDVMAATFESPRKLCMANDAPATQHDFGGLIGMMKAERANPPVMTKAALLRLDRRAR